MELHHSKHHQTYVTNLNAALEKLTALSSAGDIAGQIAVQQAAVRFNGGGHINHSLFWHNLAPASSPEASQPERVAPALIKEITHTWGGLDHFKKAFSATLLGIQGSGWGWLVREELPGAGSGVAARLKIVTTKDQDPVVGPGETPVIGVDMWEHAYYLQYLNGKAAYVENIWKVINWKTAEERFKGNREDVWKTLKAQM
jgi:Fe-Mn family superoxide dismutase